MQYWLMKTEPDVFSIDDLKKSPSKTTQWEGVRNYQARNFMRDEMKNQLNEKEAGPSLMVVYRFEPRKHNVDPKIFDSMRRAIRGGDRDFLRTAVGDQTDSRKSNTQKRVEAQKRRELRVKPMKKTNASYITVNRRNKPWYVKKDRTNIPIPWSNQEDKILRPSLERSLVSFHKYLLKGLCQNHLKILVVY